MRLRRLTGLGVVAASVAALAACSDGDGGTPVINVYGSTSDAGWTKILDACNAAAQGRYTIRPNLIPSDADSQREQFVRRLAPATRAWTSSGWTSRGRPSSRRPGGSAS